MACCNVWGTAGLNFRTTLFNIFLADLFFIYSDIDIANFADDNNPYLPAINVEDIIVPRASFSISVQMV